MATTVFCQHQLCLCRPLLALKENKFFLNTCELFPTFFLAFYGLDCKKMFLSVQATYYCAESDFSNIKFEYLRENRFFRKAILACFSGPRWVGFMEIKKCQKSRDTATLITFWKWSHYWRYGTAIHHIIEDMAQLFTTLWKIWHSYSPHYGIYGTAIHHIMEDMAQLFTTLWKQG